MSSLNITEYSSHLLLGPNNIWQSSTIGEISYPEEGNKQCFELEDKSAWFQHRNNAIIQLATHYPPQGAIFDVGGGNGYVTLNLIANGFDTVLVEPGLEGALNASKRGIENVVCSTFEDAGFSSNSIPAVGLFDTLEHIENSIEFLKGLKDKLRPGGLLYITVPAFNFLWAADDNYAGHFRRYTRTSLHAELQAAGFSIEYSCYLFAALVAPLFMVRSLPYRLFGASKINIEKVKQQHELGSGLIHNAIQSSFAWELKRLKNKQAIPFGTSCMAVARA